MNQFRTSVFPTQTTIFLLEDDPTLCALMQELLTDSGAQVFSFASADAALTHLLQSRAQCSLIIADNSLPGQISGLELLEMATQRWPHLKGILTSGSLFTPSQLPPGVMFLLKPWTIDELINTSVSLLQMDASSAQCSGTGHQQKQ